VGEGTFRVVEHHLGRFIPLDNPCLDNFLIQFVQAVVQFLYIGNFLFHCGVFPFLGDLVVVRNLLFKEIILFKGARIVCNIGGSFGHLQHVLQVGGFGIGKTGLVAFQHPDPHSVIHI